MSRFRQFSAFAALGWLALAEPASVKADWIYVVHNGQVYAVQQPSRPVYANAPASSQAPVYYNQPGYSSTSRYGSCNAPSYGRQYYYYPGARGITPFGPIMDIWFGESNGPGHPASSFGFDVYGPSWDSFGP